MLELKKRIIKTKGSSKVNRLSNIFSNPAVIILIFFAFLVIRNWSVMSLLDLRDGFLVKINMFPGGLSVSGIKEYIDLFMLQSWNGHFIPLWFIAYFGLGYVFDSNPWVAGVASFLVAATVLYLIFAIIIHFLGKHKNRYLYSLLVVLLFSSTSFFLETIAWKWMLALLMSSALYLAALLLLLKILLKKKTLSWWHLLFVLLLLSSFWTFGSSWVQGWGIVLFLILSGKNLKDRLVIITASTTLIGTITAVIANRNSTPSPNILFLLSNAPETLILAASNVIMQTIGIFRFAAIEHIYVSSVLALTLSTAICTYYFKRRDGLKLSEKDSIVMALLSTYSAIVVLSLLKIAPNSGIVPISDQQNYILGGRYLFIYSIPLVLAGAIALGGFIVRLPRYLLYIFMLGALSYGIVIQYSYHKIDPDMTNKNRTLFYNLTPEAVKRAQNQKLTLPDVKGELFWKSYSYKLSDAVKIRKEFNQNLLDFKNPDDLTSQECARLNDDKIVSEWINIYSKNWCNNI